MTSPDRDGLEVDALRTDRYLEALLAAIDRRAPETPADAQLDPDIRAAATRLANELVRVHPSFRFEERLAARLGEIARSMRLAPAAGGEAVPITIPRAPGVDDGFDPLAHPAEADADAVAAAAAAADDPDLTDLTDPVDPDVGDLRPLLIGGAITSAALSLAGAAWVAWRRARPPARSPMARAVRAARDVRSGRRAGSATFGRRLD